MRKQRDPERAEADLRRLLARRAPSNRVRILAYAALFGLLACGQGHVHGGLGVHPALTGSDDAGPGPRPSAADGSGTLADGGSAAPLALVSPPRRLRRLSNREYNNVVRDLLGDASQPAKRFLTDSYQNGYDNGSAGLAVQSDQVIGYQEAAEALAANIVATRLPSLLYGCDPNTQGAAPCLEAFLGGFVARAYRRPPTATELQRLRDVYQAGAQPMGGLSAGIQIVLEVILQSPQFLYREELGALDAVPVAGDDVSLTDYEIASELSFLLTGSIPDGPLWAAVASGNFHTTADFQRETTRLLGTPGARDTLRAFLHQWMATDRLSGLTKYPEVYPTFSRAMATSMATELDQFFDSVLWQGSASLHELLMSNQSFADPTLGALYGVAIAGPGFQPVLLDPTIRSGVLSRAGYLAVHADVDSSGPVPRGVFVMNAILCAPPPPPPPNVPPVVTARDPSLQTLTTRQRFSNHAKTPACAGCHDRIDGIGFGFEAYDGIGAYRAAEHGNAVDSSGTIIGTGEIDGPFRGLTELGTKLVASHHLLDCFARQAYRYAMGQVEGPDEPIQALTAGFSSDARMTGVLLAIVSNPIFAARRFEAAGP